VVSATRRQLTSRGLLAPGPGEQPKSLPTSSASKRKCKLAASELPRLPRAARDVLFGVEIESEGITSLNGLHRGLWNVTTDGSLRGDHKYEAVSVPVSNDRLEEAIYQYCEIAREYAEPFSWRCGTHVHMNMLDCSGSNIASTMLTSYAADNYFYAAGDEARRANYNCRPVSLLVPMAEYLGTAARHMYKGHFQKGITAMRANSSPSPSGRNSNGEQRYVGMNWYALPKLGTVELRHFPGSRDETTIFRWIHMAVCLRQFGRNNNIAQVRDAINSGADVFGQAVFGDLWPRVQYPGHDTDWEEVLEGVEHFMSRYSNVADSSSTLHGVLRQHMVIN